MAQGYERTSKKQNRRLDVPANERLAWARRLWEDDITIPVQGGNGMIRKMKAQFGAAARYEQLSDIRRAIRAQKQMDANKANVEAAAAAKDTKSTVYVQKETAAAAPTLAIPTTGFPDIPSSTTPTADAPAPSRYKERVETGGVFAPEDMAVQEVRMSAQPKRKRRKKRKSQRKFPPGSRERRSIEDRKIAAREILRGRPNMTLQGRDGLAFLLRQRFGVALKYETMKALKDDAIAALDDALTLEAARSGAEIRLREVPITPKPLVEQVTQDIEEQLRAAAEIIRDVVPNLREFKLTVDDKGQVTVDYLVKKVIVEEQKGKLELPSQDKE